jgi:hypothetical protein
MDKPLPPEHGAPGHPHGGRSLATARRWSGLVVLGVAAVLAGCATTRVVDSDVSSYTQWPADRKAGSYAFERLPSQVARPEEQAALEAAARAALERAGFTASADPASAEVLVQLGLRATRTNAWPGSDRRLWGSSVWYARPWRTPYWGTSLGIAWDDVPRYEREVAVLIRDRRSGQPLYESRAANDGTTPAEADVLAAMFEAAMKDFPAPAVTPRRVRVELPR